MRAFSSPYGRVCRSVGLAKPSPTTAKTDGWSGPHAAECCRRMVRDSELRAHVRTSEASLTRVPRARVRAHGHHGFMTPWVTLISSLGAAIIGGLVAPLVTQRRERVAARAEVRRALTDVEALRFDQDRYQEFTRALSAFEAHRRSTRFRRHVNDAWRPVQ